MWKCHTHLHHQGIWDAKLPSMSSSHGSKLLLCMREGKRQGLAAVVSQTLRKCGCFQLTSTFVNHMSLPSFSSLSLFIQQKNSTFPGGPTFVSLVHTRSHSFAFTFSQQSRLPEKKKPLVSLKHTEVFNCQR